MICYLAMFGCLVRMSAEFEYVEKPFLHLLKGLGWDTIPTEDETNKFDPKLTLRTE